jgi:thiamine pyrophosphate-dependent acetolactate synthase large subunit-like protein
MNRIEAIDFIFSKNTKAIFILSNGLTAREAAHYLGNDNAFYLLHAMGEALSVGIGLAQARPEKEIVVIDGDGNALMGMASWSMLNVKNLKYFILANGVFETTGGQVLPRFPALPKWCNVINIEPNKLESPNPPSPKIIWSNIIKTLSK